MSNIILLSPVVIDLIILLKSTVNQFSHTDTRRQPWKYSTDVAVWFSAAISIILMTIMPVAAYKDGSDAVMLICSCDQAA